MFTSAAAKIRTLHLGAQLALWPLLGIAWLAYKLVLAPLAWVVKEAGSQAASGARKVFTPLLWPLAIIAVLAAMLLAMGVEQFAQLMGPLLEAGVAFLVIGCVAYVAIRSLLPVPKKPPPRRRRK